MEAIYHAEGRCTPNGASAFHYEYTLKDHLGNARVNFRANGTAVTFLEEMHYYPFGMLMEGIGTAAVTVNKYKYNGKELNDDLGLNLSDYGARWYDAAVGRWWSVDPLAEKYASYSTYNYVINNPMLFVDPTGMGLTSAAVIPGGDIENEYTRTIGPKGSNNDNKGGGIILKGTVEQKNTLLKILQELTNDQLDVHPETGEVTTVKGKANSEKTLTEGTNLIRTLLKDDNTVTIQVSSANGTNPVGVGKGKDKEDGKQYDSSVGIKLQATNSVNADGTRGGVPVYVSLAHELFHARSNSLGINERINYQVYDFDTGIFMSMPAEEINTRMSENLIRTEHNLVQRAIPIPRIIKIR